MSVLVATLLLSGTVLGALAFSNSSSPVLVVKNSLTGPAGVAFDSHGNLWVADGENVYEYTSPYTGSPVLTISGFSLPIGIAFDSSGNLWVADINTGSVSEYASPSFSAPAAISITSPAGMDPIGVAFDSSGNLWVADNNGYVYEYTTPLSSSSTPALTISGFTAPVGIAFDSHGNLWVSDWAGSVYKYTLPYTGSPALTIKGAPLTHPYGLAFDSSGNLWVAGFYNSAVFEYTSPSYSSTPAVTLTHSLSEPFDVTFDSSGNLWVADYGAASVFEFSGRTTTTTSVICTPASVVAGSSTIITCTATVTGNSPTGTVTFSKSVGNGLVSFITNTCTLPGVCHATLKGTKGGTVVVSAVYHGDSHNFGSTGYSSVLTVKAAPSISISCARKYVKIGPLWSETCTATLSHYLGNVAGEKVTWSKIAGTGDVAFFGLPSSFCNLSYSAQCSVIVTGISPGPVTIQAVYVGDSSNAKASNTYSLTVT